MLKVWKGYVEFDCAVVVNTEGAGGQDAAGIAQDEKKALEFASCLIPEREFWKVVASMMMVMIGRKEPGRRCVRKGADEVKEAECEYQASVRYFQFDLGMQDGT